MSKARTAMALAYSHRIVANIGLAGAQLPVSENYEGDFDYLSLAESLPLPQQDNHVHDEYWQRAFEEFDRAWGEHNQRRQHG